MQTTALLTSEIIPATCLRYERGTFDLASRQNET